MDHLMQPEHIAHDFLVVFAHRLSEISIFLQ